MSEYATKADFIKRILWNYENYNKPDYEITYLLTTLCACFAFLREGKKNVCFPSAILSKIELETDKSNRNFIRHMRNALCHTSFPKSIVSKGETREIAKITFKDRANGKENFKITLGVDELESILNSIASAF